MTKKRNKNRKRSTRQVRGKREVVKRNQKDTVFRMLFREEVVQYLSVENQRIANRITQ